jgi:hypothetical protein
MIATKIRGMSNSIKSPQREQRLPVLTLRALDTSIDRVTSSGSS